MEEPVEMAVIPCQESLDSKLTKSNKCQDDQEEDEE